MADPDPAIGRYRILGILGRGAMGTIYKAHDPTIDRLVAIKLIRADLLDGAEREDFIARFHREAQAAGRCAHPNIVAIHDFALHEGNPFLVMEFVDGVTLIQARPQGGCFAPDAAVSIMLQTLAALAAAHALGVVHRDIKPANILLTGASLVKVTDFGISRLESGNLTRGDNVIGTPSYMSPEQCGAGTVDARSDLFSAGVVLFEMLSGHKPFPGASTAETLARLLHDPPADLRALAPELPAALCAVVARSLAKAPAQRFASADAMAAALREATGLAEADRTVVVPGHSLIDPASVSHFDPAVLETLSHRLAEILGPIATYLVRTEARGAESLETLCTRLGARIETPEERARFEAAVHAALGHASAAATSSPAGQGELIMAPAELERLRTALARQLGPVARVLIRRALPTAASASDLWRVLAGHIDDDAARAVFLAEAPR